MYPNHPYFESLGGTITTLREYAYDYARDWSATNPSIAYSPELGYAAMFRSSNYRINEKYYDIEVLNNDNGGSVANKVWFSELDPDTLEILNFKQVVFIKDGFELKRGVEDPRLYWRDGSWFFDAIMMEYPHTMKARVVTYKYDQTSNEATLVNKHFGPDEGLIEKNWMRGYEDNPNFDYIYGCGEIIKNNLVKKIQDISSLGLRGGSQLWDLGDSTYMAIVHRTKTETFMIYNPKKFGMVWVSVRNYTHIFARYDYRGNLIGFTDQFQFLDRGVEFASGLVEHGGDFVVSFGSKDRTSHLARIPKEKVMSMLRKVE